MKRNTSWILPAGFIALVLVAVSALRGASQQPLNIHLTRAAIATMQMMQTRRIPTPHPTYPTKRLADANRTDSNAPDSNGSDTNGPDTNGTNADRTNGENSNPSRPPVHPDEPLSVTLQQRFSISNSLERVKQVDQALKSFRTLTQKSQTVLTPQVIAAIGNTDAETQTLGFFNWLGAIEGTLRQQDRRIKFLDYQLAKKQYKDGEISQATLTQKAAAYQQSNQAFNQFLNSFRIAD